MDHFTKVQLDRAARGDINAFQELFKTFQEELKTYLFRLLASRADAEDLTHDTFIRAFDKVASFRGEASFKTWVFRIATNLAYKALSKRRRWVEDVKGQAKDLVLGHPSLRGAIEGVHRTSEFGRFEMREHIDTCFTCMAKNLPIENQVALILKDVYDFSVKEIQLILDRSEGQVKYLLQTARKTLTDLFERRCALVNKNGVCHQCSELNGWFNPKQRQQEAKMKLQLVRRVEDLDARALFRLRLDLVKSINPLRSEGYELQEILLNCNRMAMGELKIPGAS
ncbi:MAG: RNA polymerase sigma factor [Bacteroidota bacterium]